MPLYSLRPRPDRYTTISSVSSGAPLGAERQTSSSSSDTYKPPRKRLYCKWNEAPTYDDEGNMNVPELPRSFKKALEEGMGLREDHHQWRKLGVRHEFVSS